MERLLDLKRCWRDIHVSPESQTRSYARWLLQEEDVESQARIGLYRLDALARYECLFLLGRPGAGKTSEVARITRGEIANFADEFSVLIACKEISPQIDSEVARVPEWRSALQQTKPVRLILDALDEGYLRDANYFNALKLSLRNLRAQHPALRLLLVCRPAEWDSTFGRAVHEIWDGDSEPKAFALEPLWLQSQKELAESWGASDTKSLFRWINRNNFEEFADWPRSLKWLTEQFCSGESDRITYTELCRQRAMRSFPEEDRRIQEAGRIERVETWTHALMTVAATTVFCAKKGIALNGSEPDCLTPDDLFQDNPALDMPRKLSLTRPSVREAMLASDLTEGHRGYHRFQNQSDLEYLASAMLVSLNVEQLAELFGADDEVDGWHVFPQLATTAANLAGQSKDFFDWVLKRDPRVLMRMDFSSKSPKTKETAIQALVAATRTANSTGSHDEHAHFSTLRYPGIEDQLGPWLFDDTVPFAARQLVFDIAFACCGSDFWIEFDRHAAADTEGFFRSKLPSVVNTFGHLWPEARLRSIASTPDDRSAAAAMNALLNAGWKPKALAPFLHEPSGDLTAYTILLSKQIPQACAIEDVPPLLTKIKDWETCSSQGSPARDLAQALIAKAVTGLNRADVRKSLVEFLRARLDEHNWFFDHNTSKILPRFGLDDVERRHALLLVLADADFLHDPEAHLISIYVPLLPEDYPWLLGELAIARGPRAGFLAKLTSSIIWQIGEEHAEEIDRVYSASAELRALYPFVRGPSFFAQIQQWQRENAARRQIEMEKYRSEKPQPRHSNQEILDHALKECCSGRIKWWPTLCHGLSQPRFENDFADFTRHTDIRELAGWQAGTEQDHYEFARFARDFLLHGVVPQLPAGRSSEKTIGLVYALNLHSANFSTDASLRDAAKPVWIQALLRQTDETTANTNSLLAIAATAPEITSRGLEDEFRDWWERDQIFHHPMLSAIWSELMEDTLVRVLDTSPLQPVSYDSGIKLLLEHNPERARILAKKRLVEHLAQPNTAARRSAIGICLFTINELWEDAWPYFLADLSVAREIVLDCKRWLELRKEDKGLADMPTAFITQLYSMLLQTFPLQNAPQQKGGRFVTPEFEAYDVQTQLRDTLTERGAYRELQTIFSSHSELTDYWWVGRSLEQARTNAHAQRRVPPTAAEFIRFLATEGGTFIRDDTTLQNAVMASLRRFEQQLHPLVITTLWDRSQPRKEESLQVEIVRHLQSDFEKRKLVVNMEVKVEGRQGVDVLVEAAPFSVTLEVKQAHAKDADRPVLESMRLQLRDTYLKNSRRTHGIYVVGWYFCSAFRPRGLPEMKSIGDASTFFNRQAISLSTEGYVLKSAVIDCGWVESITARSKKRRQSGRKRASKRG